MPVVVYIHVNCASSGFFFTRVLLQLSSFCIVIIQAWCMFDFARLVLWLGCFLAIVVNSYLSYVPYIGLGSETQVHHVMRHRSGML